MARPPRGRLPGKGRQSDETGENELPLDLPRVEPVRPRAIRMPRAELKLDVKNVDEDVENGPRPVVPPLRVDSPEPPAAPSRIEPERIENPFDYYAMPKDESASRSRPIARPSAPPSPSSEFLTAKYYQPRSDLTAQRLFDENADQTANWARSVRPGRPILDPPSSDDDDDTPFHLRHLPSRVRDHLRSEPKMPQAFEAPDSLMPSTQTTPQWRARSTVPVPLATELRAPGPQEMRVTHSMPDGQITAPFNATRRAGIEGDEGLPDDRFPRSADPEFDSASDEAVTEIDRNVPPLFVEDEAQIISDYAAAYREEVGLRDTAQMPRDLPRPLPASLIRSAGHAVPAPSVPVSDWEQDEALHALTSRIRSRADAPVDRPEAPPRRLFPNLIPNAIRRFGAQMRSKVSNRKIAVAQTKAEAEAEAEAEAQIAAGSTFRPNADLRATREFEPDHATAFAPVHAPEFGSADTPRPRAPHERWSFIKSVLRGSNIRNSVVANRAHRRKRQSRLYEDIVAWIVVPPFIIGAIYGALEVMKFIQNSPLGKILSGQ